MREICQHALVMLQIRTSNMLLENKKQIFHHRDRRELKCQWCRIYLPPKTGRAEPKPKPSHKVRKRSEPNSKSYQNAKVTNRIEYTVHVHVHAQLVSTGRNRSNGV